MCTQYMDELVREYLLYRGFVSSVKAFDNELKNDKDKAFRADRIVDQFTNYISAGDLNGLRELWSHLDSYVFSKCGQQMGPAIKKLESSLLKLYIIISAMNGKNEKALEFFEKFGSEFQNNSEWKDWFAFPFTKNAEDSPTFAVYFTKQWQDTILISLHNLLAIAFQSIPQPTLMAHAEEAARISRLQSENEQLQSRLKSLQICTNNQEGSSCSISVDSLPAGLDLIDDFYLVAPDSSPVDLGGRTFRSFIRNFSGNSVGSVHTSPLANRRGQSSPSPMKP